MDGRELFVPPWYVSESPAETDMNVCSIIWGFSLCSALFTATKAVRQSWSAYKKDRLLSTYLVLVWAEWSASVVISIISWLFLRETIPPSTNLLLASGYSLSFVSIAYMCLWVVQMHCILQIIINRVSLVMVNRVHARYLKLGVFFIVLTINISVFCIWIPARLQINETYVRVNDIWDRIEKAIFAVVDAGLNCCFMWTVRTNLIAAGLVKYQPLFRFNLMMVCISVALDVVLIGSMSIGTGVIYIQFHPLVYLTKLYIELNMAELLAKVVRATNPITTATDTGDTLCVRDISINKCTQMGLPIRSHRDYSINLTNMGRGMDLGEQGVRYPGIDYHMALRASVSHSEWGDTTLGDI
ncbi:hypothetical protein BKA67DRAFT_527256 [Truncatella angustata]|uniref:Integral membrane protein n=1 Tax=Truncatella angustata TaxID=152316 RepID=A0A9P8RK59_9PEZI|nr:uncharacterized protein BKA67DRAFT_527256 [Truncatella angustata]KAH6645541.1 hypothetical protein BKA67DRAFT_527256 [Truncatella angustata]